MEDDLRSQLEQQKKTEVKSKGGTQDQRNPGLQRVYFFKRLVDNNYFGIDNERQASHLLRRKDFNTKFEYLGWSSGQNTKKLAAQKSEVTTFNDEGGISEEGKEVHERNLDRYFDALALDIEEAQGNPDKTPPRDFRKRDLSGAPLQGVMGEYLNMFNR